MSYKTFAEWLKKSNEAGIFREAFELNDKMPLEHSLRSGCFDVIYIAAKAAYQKAKEELK